MDTIDIRYLAETFVHFYGEDPSTNLGSRAIRIAKYGVASIYNNIAPTSFFNHDEIVERHRSKNTGHLNQYDLELLSAWKKSMMYWNRVVKQLEADGYNFESTREEKRFHNGMYTWEREFKIKFNNITLRLGNKMMYPRLADEVSNQQYICSDNIDFINYVQKILYKKTPIVL